MNFSSLLLILWLICLRLLPGVLSLLASTTIFTTNSNSQQSSSSSNFDFIPPLFHSQAFAILGNRVLPYLTALLTCNREDKHASISSSTSATKSLPYQLLKIISTIFTGINVLFLYDPRFSLWSMHVVAKFGSSCLLLLVAYCRPIWSFSLLNIFKFVFFHSWPHISLISASGLPAI